MFTRTFLIGILLFVAAAVDRALGHGHPIVVTQTDNRLIVSGGVQGLGNGFASQVYVETGSAGDPQDYMEPEEFGPAIYWVVPGFEITGLAVNSGLYLQPLARPVSSNPGESRVLWYWNVDTSALEIALPDSRMEIRRDSSEYEILSPSTTVPPLAIKVADPLAGDMGYHNHDLMKFLLPYVVPDEQHPDIDGAYGFFARLTSDVYAPSDPFLVVINNGGLAGSQMLAAAAAINQEAAATLQGDFNHSNQADAADYVVWRKTLTTTSDYALWRENFGQSIPSAGQFDASAIPEPSAGLLIVSGLIGVSLKRQRRTRVLRRPFAHR